MNRSIPFPEDGEGTYDVVLNLPYLQLGGIGLHAISVHFWYDGVENESDEADEIPAWSIDPEEMFHTKGWVFGAVEYFWIEYMQ